jgi:exodeoxyribonuclease VII small subunit
MSAKPAAQADSMQPETRYAQAVEELDKILKELENDTIDVDDLAARVRRASELIQLCRDRLTRTKMEIEQIVKDLESFEQEASEEEGG